ncbi:ATP-grasp domain-containing protein [Streptomyces sp. NPDC003023]|uniref:carboxylate--amine ligase n=1 Tax=Streptomyces sp. NPDC003023 TaxID=3364675 RepID=UPI00369A4901
MTRMPITDPGVPALVLRLDRNPFHHGTLGAVRSLGRAGVEVHALVESARSPVARSRHLHRAHVRPPGDLGPEAFVGLLVEVSERIGRPAVLVAMDDLGALSVAAHAPRLASRFLFPEQAADATAALADKAELARLCADAGIAHPETVVPGSAAEAAAAVRRLGLPLVAKWSRPWLLDPGTGLRSTSLITSPGDAQRLFGRTGQAGSRLLLQRHLPGGPDSDWFFHGYFSRGSLCLLGGTGRKELAWPPRAGLTAKGRWQHNDEVRDAALRLVAHSGYQGVLDLDFRRDPAGGAYRLLDVNPRPGAQFRLFTDEGGLDVVRSLYLDLTGRPVPPATARPGRVFVAENYALLSALASARHPAPGRPGAPRGGIETAWFARDDVRPFLAMAAASLRRGLAKGTNRARTVPRRPTQASPAASEAAAPAASEAGSEAGPEPAGPEGASTSCTTWQ